MRRVPWLETGLAALLFAGLLLPAFLGYGAWIPALGLAIGCAAIQGIVNGQRPAVPVAIAVYLAIYALAAIHETSSVIEAGKYFAPPVLAIAVAWATIGRPAARGRVMLMAVAAVAVQVPVAIVQVADVLIEYGSDSIAGADNITGLLGEGAPGTLTEVGILVGLLAIAAGYIALVPRRIAYGIGFAFLLLGSLTSTRSSYVFDPIALAAIAVLIWLAARTVVDRNTRRLATALPVLCLVVLIPLTGLLYPGANSPFESKESAEATLATGDSGGKTESEPGSYVPPTTILPGRSAQLRLAFDLTTEEDLATALVGNGVGSTRFKEQSLLSDTGTTTDPITREEQQVNGIWFPRVLTETGVVGAAAFALLIAFICLLAWRNRAEIASRSTDGALVLALPGIAALTLVGAFFNTVLAIQPYASIFWPLLGLAIAIDAERRGRSEAVGRPT